MDLLFIINIIEHLCTVAATVYASSTDLVQVSG